MISARNISCLASRAFRVEGETLHLKLQVEAKYLPASFDDLVAEWKYVPSDSLLALAPAVPPASPVAVKNETETCWPVDVELPGPGKWRLCIRWNGRAIQFPDHQDYVLVTVESGEVATPCAGSPLMSVCS